MPALLRRKNADFLFGGAAVSGGRDDLDGDQGALRGTQAAAAGGKGATSPVPADAAAPMLPIDDLLPLAIPSAGHKGAGRPRGSVNIRTNKTFQAAVSRYGDPLIASIAWGNMDTRELITEMRKIASDCGIKLGATVMDVVRFQEQCRSAALPYGHAKRAPVNEVGHDVTPVLIMGGGRGSVTNVAVGGGAMSIEDRIAAEREAKRNQQVIDSAANVSHDGKSHNDATD